MSEVKLIVNHVIIVLQKEIMPPLQLYVYFIEVLFGCLILLNSKNLSNVLLNELFPYLTIRMLILNITNLSLKFY